MENPVQRCGPSNVLQCFGVGGGQDLFGVQGCPAGRRVWSLSAFFLCAVCSVRRRLPSPRVSSDPGSQHTCTRAHARAEHRTEDCVRSGRIPAAKRIWSGHRRRDPPTRGRAGHSAPAARYLTKSPSVRGVIWRQRRLSSSSTVIWPEPSRVRRCSTAVFGAAFPHPNTSSSGRRKKSTSVGGRALRWTATTVPFSLRACASRSAPS